MAATASAQNVQYTGKSADLALRSDLKVNPSTHGLELQIPLASYPGRAGFGLPVTYTYSSKLWRIKYGYFNPQTSTTGVIAMYSEHAAAGWNSSLSLPVFDDEQPGNIPLYDNYGYPVSGCLPGNCYSIDRIMLRMPDGSGHEMRSRDEPFAGSSPSPLPDEIYSVDGSRLRYKRSTKELFLPDGSRYILTSPTSAQYIDRHGNTLTYSNGVWTDTLGRSIQSEQNTSAAGESVLSLPGVDGVPVNYTFRRLNLSAPGVLSPGQQLSYISSNACTTGSTSPALFSTFGTVCFANNYLFDPVVLHQIVLPNGQVYTFNYNSYGELDKVTYPTGGYERYVYSKVESPSWVGDPYDKTNRGVVSSFVSASGSGTDEVEWQYASSSLGNDQYLMSQTAPDGTRTERLLHREGHDSKFGYSLNGGRAGMAYEERVYSAAEVMLRRKLTEWAFTGSSATHQGAENASKDPRVVKEVNILLDTGGNALAATTTYEYDADFNVAATHKYGYVSVAQATAQTGLISSFTPQGLLRTDEATYLVNDPGIDSATRAAYRARQLLSLPTSTRVKDGAGTIIAKTAIKYDEAAYPLLTYASVPNWTNPQTNVRGLATTASAWENTTDTWVSAYTQYDQCGSPRKIWDANGNLTQVTYSSTYKYAYPTSTTSPDPDGAGPVAQLTTSAVYDLMTGRVTSKTDPNGRVATTEYATVDALGNANPLQRATKVSMPGGGWTAYGYSDEPGDLYVLTKIALDDSRSAEGRRHFDGLGRGWRGVIVDGANSIYSDTQYDNMGRVSKVSNPYRAGQTAVWTTTTYDPLGRVLTVKTPDNAQVTTSYSGNQMTVTDQAGRARKGVRDSLGRLVQVVEDPAGLAYQTNYTHDVLGNLKTVSQGSQTRTFTYDSLSRLKSAASPESGTVTYQYDDNGNLTQRKDARNVTADYTYDALNRVTLRNYSDTTPDVTYTYDTLTNGKGRLTSVSSSVSATAYTGYDAAGRVTGSTQTTDGQTYSMGYSYDLVGNLTSQTYPSGRVVTYTYDDAGRLSQVGGQKAGEADKTYASSFSYAAHGAVSDVKLGNNLWEHTNFNNRFQPIEIGLGTVQDGVNRLKLNYTYGTTANNGNVLTHSITVPTIGAATGFTASQSFTYDELNRLEVAQEASGATWKQTFLYDQHGNRNFDADNTTPAQLGSNLTINLANNRYNSGQGQVLYDASGNLTRDYSGHTFSFDAEGRQTKYDGGATVAGGATYSYDGDGRRVKKVIGGTTLKTTVFVYTAMGHLVAEYDDSAQPSAGGTSYFTTDKLGSPRIITDSNGAVKARHDYLPFGEEIGLSGGRTEQQGYVVDNFRQGFTGFERDDETALEYAQARYYGSTQGRFTSADPLLSSGRVTKPQTWNRYSYCVNNPLKFIDPFGLAHWTDDGHFVGDKDREYNKDLNAHWNAKEGVWDFVGKHTAVVIRASDDIFPDAMGTLSYMASRGLGREEREKYYREQEANSRFFFAVHDKMMQPETPLLLLAPAAIPAGGEFAEAEGVEAAVLEEAEVAEALVPAEGVLNIGGLGEVAGATNVNTLANVANSAEIPNLVVADGANIGNIFQAGSATRIVSSKLPFGSVNWPNFANGAFKVLAPGGRLEMNIHSTAAEAQTVVKALNAAGFRNVNVSGEGWGTMITTTR